MLWAILRFIHFSLLNRAAIVANPSQKPLVPKSASLPKPLVPWACRCPSHLPFSSLTCEWLQKEFLDHGNRKYHILAIICTMSHIKFGSLDTSCICCLVLDTEIKKYWFLGRNILKLRQIKSFLLSFRLLQLIVFNSRLPQ